MLKKKKKVGLSKTRPKKTRVCVQKLDKALKQLDELSKEAQSFFNEPGDKDVNK